MMPRALAIILLLMGLIGAAAHAADRGTPDEAKAMAMKAADYLRQAGPEVAFAAFNAKDGPWHDRDLYVFVTDPANKVHAHGGNVGLVGRDMTTLRDVDGKLIFVMIGAVKDTGWVEYKWQDPVTKAIEPKTTYVVRDGEYTVGVGAYK
jgi:hypothetical protein